MTVPDPLQIGDYEPETIEKYSTDPKDLTEIQRFYKDTNIFITGATGFLGLVLVEKLLRSCKELSTIYILVRNKKDKKVSTRIEEYFDDVVFERLKVECPKFRHKVVGIAGDCSLPGLGISPGDRKTLVENVNIVFHVAATVRFDEKLKTAVAINIRGTQEMLELAREIPYLKSYIHVSTAYSNCVNRVVEEKFYPPAVNYKNLILMAETLPDKLLDKITPMLIDKYPNTYAFTKQIAEGVVKDCGKNLPVGITRPAVVVSTVREPFRAWVNNVYGVSGVVAGAGVGLIRCLNVDGNCNANIVPVDMCVNSMISAAWDVADQFSDAKISEKPYEVPIYNFESNNDCPITWRTFIDGVDKFGTKTPTIKAIWYISFTLIKSVPLYTLYAFLVHTLPAYMIDMLLVCIGKKPKMVKVYSKIAKLSGVLAYFATQSWIYKSHNVHRVCDKMSDRDKRIFFSDLRELDWAEFIKFFGRGIRVFLIQDSMETLPAALKKWRRLYWAHQILKAILGFLFLRIMWSVVLFGYDHIFS